LAKLERAKALMASLGSEREGWLRAADELEVAQGALTVNTLLAGCAIAYLGPFEGSYREDLLKRWKLLVELSGLVRASSSFDLGSVAGDNERMQQWSLLGIPDDQVSCENMIILEQTASQKFPVLIDPQE
jgi:dynein heavy chain